MEAKAGNLVAESIRDPLLLIWHSEDILPRNNSGCGADIYQTYARSAQKMSEKVPTERPENRNVLGEEISKCYK